MNINSISFGKRIQKSNLENKNEKNSTGVDSREMGSKTSLEKIRSNTAAYYAALLGLATAGGTMTSCVQQDQETIVDLDMEEFKKMFQQLMEIQNQILEQLQQNSEDNKEIIAQLKSINGVLSKIYSGVIDIKEGVTQIKDIIIESNENDKEFINKIDTIIQNQSDSNKALQEILEENKKQNAWLANIAPYIEQVANISAVTGDTLQKFYEAYQKGELGHSEFNEKLLNAVINNGNISSDILAEIKDFRKDFEAGRLTEAELLQKIADLLASIDGKMDVVIDKLNDINGNIVKLADKIDANHAETIDALTNLGDRIDNGFEINQSQMNELIQLSKDGNKNTTQILVEMDNLKDVLLQIKEDNGNLSIEELMKKYGNIMTDSFKEVIELLKEGNEADINNVVDIINAINNAKPDLSKIQEQMGTVILLLQNAQSSNITAADLQPIVEGLKNLQASNEQGNDKVNANLAQIIADMAEIKGMMNVIVETQGQILKNMDKYAASAEVAFEQIGSDMKAFLENQLTQEKLDESLSKVKTDLTQVEASMSQGVTLLQAILESQGKGESGMTPDELAEVINNSTVLNQIKDLLGDLGVDRVTNETLNNALNIHKTDLSKVQEQMGTIILLLQNSSSGDNITIDTSKLETAINELVSTVEGQGVTSNTAMKEISQKLQQLIDKFNEETEQPATRMVKLAEVKTSRPMTYQVSLQQIQDAYRQAMMA